MFGDTPLWFVDDAEGLARAAAELRNARVVGVDTESDSFHHYQEKVCLLQFSDLHRDYIVDPLAIGDLSPLAPMFEDPKIIKIFHGADYDMVCLQRDFGFKFRNLFDTMIAAQMAGMPRVGLADLIGHWFGHDIDKQYQRHDWAARPLLDEHIQYARGDTHFLLALRELLIREVKKVGRYAHVREECALLERRVFAPREVDPDAWTRTKGSVHLGDKARRVLRRVWQYRDGEARKADRPAFKILPDPVLVKVAETLPRSPDDLDRLFPRMTALRRRFGKGILDAVHQGLTDESLPPSRPAPARPVRKGPRARLTGRSAERALAALKEWRNGLMGGDRSLSPVTVVSNSVLKHIASARPTTLEELSAVQDVRRWQVKEYGPQMLAVLDASVPWTENDEPTSSPSEGDASEAKKRRRRRRRREPSE
jgi:ribonuclease D